MLACSELATHTKELLSVELNWKCCKSQKCISEQNPLWSIICWSFATHLSMWGERIQQCKQQTRSNGQLDGSPASWEATTAYLIDLFVDTMSHILEQLKQGANSPLLTKQFLRNSLEAKYTQVVLSYECELNLIGICSAMCYWFTPQITRNCIPYPEDRPIWWRG